MNFAITSYDGNVATVTFSRGKVNAINEDFTAELKTVLRDLESDLKVKAVVLTGKGKFFSFGLDVPELYGYSREAFKVFVSKFADLYTYIFSYSKPIIAALNGHTTAGGCMIATACDYRLMVNGKGRIGLNEITFGSSLFPGSVEMLRYCVGDRNAQIIGFSGAMFSPEEAVALGLVDKVASEEEFPAAVRQLAKDFSVKCGPAFQSIKMLLRHDVTELMKRKDAAFADKMIDIWYSEGTRRMLKNITIHG
jgi:Delta3-Delta2-enoyl-CoA isomerase